MASRILIIEDDNDINRLLQRILEKAGYETETAFSGTEGNLLLSLKTFDLVLMDLMLPGMSGEELLTQLRHNLSIPVIVLSAKESLDDKVKVLGLGADDYMTKPFEKPELLARIQAQLRRSQTYSKSSGPERENTQEDKLVCRGLTLFPEYLSATLNGTELTFTTYEFRILQVMMTHPQKVFSKESLYQAVWNEDSCIEDNSISVHISNIRKKLSQVSDEEFIKTVWGLGYKISN